MFEIKLNISKNIRTKDVCVVKFPINKCRILKSLMYTGVCRYKHPVIVTRNHFTLPKGIQEILKEQNDFNKLHKIKLESVTSQNDFYFYVGCFSENKRRERRRIYLTVNKKIRDLLKLKERDVIEIFINNHGPFYARTWIQRNKGKSMFIIFPEKIFVRLNLKPKRYYQIKMKKSNKKTISNYHFYSTEQKTLLFSKYLKNKKFNLHKFLNDSYAQTRSGQIRRFEVKTIKKDEMLVSYLSGGPESKKIKIKSTFLIDENFFRLLGLIQAEGSKSIKKNFCFTNKTSQNVKYVIDWFEKYLKILRNGWTHELTIDPRVKSYENAINFWSKSLSIQPKLLKVYTKKTIAKIPGLTGTMNLRTVNRTLQQITMRLLESVSKYIKENNFAAGNFLSGILAGDGAVYLTKTGYINHIAISFDPNKIWDNKSDELSIYLDCLKTLNIPKENIRIYITKHQKIKKFISDTAKFNIKVNIHKGNSIGFGGEICIFGYENFKKLSVFKPFYPNKINTKKFSSALNKYRGRWP